MLAKPVDGAEAVSVPGAVATGSIFKECTSSRGDSAEAVSVPEADPVPTRAARVGLWLRPDQYSGECLLRLC